MRVEGRHSVVIYELSCIFALITGDNVEFILRADHGLHELVKDWLLDSTAPVFVN